MYYCNSHSKSPGGAHEKRRRLKGLVNCKIVVRTHFSANIERGTCSGSFGEPTCCTAAKLSQYKRAMQGRGYSSAEITIVRADDAALLSCSSTPILLLRPNRIPTHTAGFLPKGWDPLRVSDEVRHVHQPLCRLYVSLTSRHRGQLSAAAKASTLANFSLSMM